MNLKSSCTHFIFISWKILCVMLFISGVLLIAVLDAVIFLMCCVDSVDDRSKTSGPYNNAATGEIDATKSPDGIYPD